jgi:hypothetical protein
LSNEVFGQSIGNISFTINDEVIAKKCKFVTLTNLLFSLVKEKTESGFNKPKNTQK